MASSTPNDDAARKRIITHMNNDHRDSVIRYVENYCKVSRLSSRSAVLKDISLDKMIITAGGQDHTVRINPPMTSLGQARERVVEMDRDSIKALNRSPITIKEHRAPKGIPLVVAVACLTAYIFYSRDSFTAPGSLVDRLLPFGLNKLVYKGRVPIFYFLVIVHGLEMIPMARKLEKHSVPLFSDVWFKWIINVFLEGFTSFQRFDALVKREERKKAQEKH